MRGHLLFRATHLTSLPPKNAKLAAENKTKKAADSSSPATGLSAQAQIQGFASPPRDGYAFSEPTTLPGNPNLNPYAAPIVANNDFGLPGNCERMCRCIATILF